MAKRTQQEIEKDFKKIREAAKTAISIKEIERKTGLSNSAINTSLAKHPTISKRIKEQLAENKEKVELEAKARKEQEELEAKAKKEKAKLETKNQEESSEESKHVTGYVLDASMTGIMTFDKVISKICKTQEKIILTSVTIKELEKMQRFNDHEAMDARHILAMAAEQPEKFITVLIDETLYTPDDCIIKYCADNRQRVTLLTSDKTMALKARMYSVQVEYFKQDKAENPANRRIEKLTKKRPNESYYSSNIRTLFPARKVGNQLFIFEMNTREQSIVVSSNGIEYTEGTIMLKIGDDVYISTKKLGYITFAHYKVISLNSENNCKLVYAKRIYNNTEINNLPQATYKSILKDFKIRHDV